MFILSEIYRRVRRLSCTSSFTDKEERSVPMGDRTSRSLQHNEEETYLCTHLGDARDDGTFYLDTDASNFGLGAVLSQDQDGREVVLAYASRTLSNAEKNYEVTRRELLAVVYGLKVYRQYLLGRKFVIRTDHSALQ